MARSPALQYDAEYMAAADQLTRTLTKPLPRRSHLYKGLRLITILEKMPWVGQPRKLEKDVLVYVSPASINRDRSVEDGRMASMSLLGQPVEWRVELLGGIRLACGDRSVPINKRKARALLGFLVLNGSSAESREKISGLLWSEFPEDKARASLRQILLHLRGQFRSIGVDALTLGRDEILLNRAGLSVDVWDVTEAVVKGDVHAALLDTRRLPGQLMLGFEDTDPGYRVWLLVQRQTWQERLERHLNVALAAAKSAQRSRDVAIALLNLDPTHEPACRHLMHLSAERGDISGALKAYKSLWDVLEDEYDTEPSDETKGVLVRIRNGEIEPRRDVDPPGPPPASWPASPQISTAIDPEHRKTGRHAIIVAPFHGLGLAEDLSYLLLGLRHGVISRLVCFRDWTVIDGTMPSQSAETSVRRFCVDAMLLPGPSAHVFTVTLKDVDSGRFIWSRTLDFDVRQWFIAQRSLIRRLAAELNVHVSAERLAAVARSPDVSLSVFDRSLKGWMLILEWRPGSWKRAHEIFRSIVREAPNFPSGYIGLVRLRNTEHLVFPGKLRSRDLALESLDQAKIAVQADPFDCHAQHCFAWSSALFSRFDQAEISFGLAVDLNENDPWVLISSALGFAYCGRHARALELADQAYEIDPSPSFSHWGYQTQTRLMCGDYEGAASAAENAQDVLPFIKAWQAAALAHCNRLEEAKGAAAAFLIQVRANWHGTEAPTDEAVTNWLLRCFPIRNPADWERLRTGIEVAGLATVASSHVHCAIV